MEQDKLTLGGVWFYLRPFVMRTINYTGFAVLALFWFDFIWAPWSNWNATSWSFSWNLAYDFLFTRTGGTLLYGNHIVSAVAMMAVATYFVFKSLKNVWLAILPIFATASVHELLLDTIMIPAVGGAGFANALRDGPLGNTNLGSATFSLNEKWMFWLLLALALGLLVASGKQRKTLAKVATVCVAYDSLWLCYLLVSHHSPWTLLTFGPGPMFHDPIDNSLEIFGWLVPLSVWVVPDDFRGACKRMFATLKEYLQMYLVRAYFALYLSTPLRGINLKGESIIGSVLSFSRIAHWSDDAYVKLNGYVLHLKGRYARVILGEGWLWQHYYDADVRGKVVMDVGAGCGETAAFFLGRGAKSIVAIEQDPECVSLMRENALRNGWDIQIINEPFQIEQLSIPHDLLKMDIEGGEAALLKYEGKLGPCRLELHPMRGFLKPEVVDEIISKFGLRAVRRPYHWGRDS